jgi:hypothetical protein
VEAGLIPLGNTPPAGSFHHFDFLLLKYYARAEKYFHNTSPKIFDIFMGNPARKNDLD